MLYRPVSLEVASRRELNAALNKLRPASPSRQADEVAEVRGTLRALHLDEDWLEVVAVEEGGPKAVRILEAGEVLDDVVGPMVNHRVVVTAVRRKGRLLYRDIESDD